MYSIVEAVVGVVRWRGHTALPWQSPRDCDDDGCSTGSKGLSGWNGRRRSCSDFDVQSSKIQFSGTVAQYCIVGYDHESPPNIEDLQFPWRRWTEEGLQFPNVILDVVGGAALMTRDGFLFNEAEFSKSLVRAATRTGAWIVTGGTASGVMKMVGEAMEKHDKQRRVPLLGICPYGGLTSKWRDGLRRSLDNQEVLKAEEGFPPEVDKGALLAQVDCNHSHFVFVDSGCYGKDGFGKETKFRQAFQEHLATLSVESSSPTGVRRSSAFCDESPPHRQEPVPRAMIVVNGGRITLKNILEAVCVGCPVVVCKGTGRIADAICTFRSSGLRELCGDPPSEELRGLCAEALGSSDFPDQMCSVSTDLPSSPSSQRAPRSRMLTRTRSLGTACEAMAMREETTRTAVLDTICAIRDLMAPERLDESDWDMLHQISASWLVDEHSRDTHLEDVVLGAMLHVGGSAMRKLKLALTWGCSMKYGDLCTRYIKDCEQCVSKAISGIFMEFVSGTRAHEGGKGPGETPQEGDASPLVQWLLTHHRREMIEFDLADSMGPKGALQWDHGGAPTKPTRSLEGLLLWSIERHASQAVLETIWLEMEDPVHAALVAAAACRRMAQTTATSFTFNDERVRDSLEEKSRFFEKLAILTLQELAKVTDGSEVAYLFQKPRCSGPKYSMALFHLAHELVCKEFIASRFYNLAVNRYWLTPACVDDGDIACMEAQLDEKHVWVLFIRFLWSWMPESAKPALWQKADADAELACGSLTWLQVASTPYIKAHTHGLSRLGFSVLYSWAVFNGHLSSQWNSAIPLKVALLSCGIGMGELEWRQFSKKNRSFKEYLQDFWNVIDVVYISVLLLGLAAGVTLISDHDSRQNGLEHLLECAHALNLLFVYLRVLQTFQLSEYFGTLLLTVVAMGKDFVYFFLLLSIVCLGFSNALTPMLATAGEERMKLGISWSFWALLGEVDENVKVNVKDRDGLTGYFAQLVLYLLMIGANVLLVNLLICTMNDTYNAKRSQAQTEWALVRVNAVVEFGEVSILPPPFNLVERIPWARHSSTPSSNDRAGRRRSAQARRHDREVRKDDLRVAKQRAIGMLHGEPGLDELQREGSEIARARSHQGALHERVHSLECKVDLLLEENRQLRSEILDVMTRLLPSHDN